MSDFFTYIRRFSNSFKHFLAIEIHIKESDIENLPLLRDHFYLTDTEKCFLRLDLEESSHHLSLELSNPELCELITGFSVFIIDDDGKTIHGIKVFEDEISSEGDFLQDFVEHYTDIKFPVRLFLYMEARNDDFKNVKNVQSTEIVKSETDIFDKEQIDCLLELSSDFKKIQDTGTDVTLNVGGMKVKVHETVLQARSPRLHKMFEHSSNKCIDIKDVRLSIVKEFIGFLYTGTKKSYDFESAKELYSIAAKYEVPSLRNVCMRDMLSRHIQKNNACLMLILADQHQDVPFKEEVMVYIRANLKSIIETRSFKDLSDNFPQLALSTLCNHIRES